MKKITLIFLVSMYINNSSTFEIEHAFDVMEKNEYTELLLKAKPRPEIKAALDKHPALQGSLDDFNHNLKKSIIAERSPLTDELAGLSKEYRNVGDLVKSAQNDADKIKEKLAKLKKGKDDPKLRTQLENIEKGIKLLKAEQKILDINWLINKYNGELTVIKYFETKISHSSLVDSEKNELLTLLEKRKKEIVATNKELGQQITEQKKFIQGQDSSIKKMSDIRKNLGKVSSSVKKKNTLGKIGGAIQDFYDADWLIQ